MDKFGKVIIVIPSRLASQRLPDKPLLPVGDQPMIVQVLRRAEEAAVGPVLVACGDQAIADAVRRAGGTAVMTAQDLPSGSDRVWAAVCAADAGGDHDLILNLQGDLPTIAPDAVRAVLRPLADPAVDVATLASPIVEAHERNDPNVVKVVYSPGRVPDVGRALYFTRATAPSGDGPLYHHIGIYAYRRAALERFVDLPPSPLELRERLEQLRALEAGMRIDVALTDHVPLGVDTPDDLARARRLLGA